MDRFTLQNLPLYGLKLIKRSPIADKRGFLQRLYCKETLAAAGVTELIIQINHTLTHLKGAVRGMHFQNFPYAETKMVSCLRGKVFDVALDLRRDSPTFLKWHAEILAPELNNSLVIPQGFAHGFQALDSDCELLYFHTAPYHQPAEGGISPIDGMINITWPMEITELSERDKNHPLLTNHFKGLTNEM